jgi:hypothetical protein
MFEIDAIAAYTLAAFFLGGPVWVVSYLSFRLFRYVKEGR